MQGQSTTLFGDSAETHRTCKACKRLLPLDDFYLHRQKGKLHRLKTCKPCHNKRVNERYLTERGQRQWKAAFLRHTYGITIEEYESLLAAQSGVCALCGQTETRLVKRTGQPQLLCVDHCHKTGALRGLLCHNCNAGLGRFRDDISRLQAAISYLKKHSSGGGAGSARA